MSANKAQVSRSVFVDDAESRKYITEVVDNNVWRKAITVDGRTFWATDKPGELGEPVVGSYKFRHYGDYMLLAPREGATKEDPNAGQKNIREENDARFFAFLETVVDKLWNFLSEGDMDETPDGGPRQLTEERMRNILKRAVATIRRFRPGSGAEGPQQRLQLDRKSLKAALMMELDNHLSDLLVDGVLIKDIHGRLDLDFDNYGPELVSEPQMIDRGLVAWQVRESEEEQKQAYHKRASAFLPLHRETPDDPNDGFESDTSLISQDHCRVSPYYPPCGESCWLRSLEPTTEKAVKEPEIFAVPSSFATEIYKPLEPGCIRFVVLNPGSVDDEVVCSLETRNMSDVASNLDFEALSYSWGDPTHTHTITCNDSAFGVAANLYHALRHLRFKDRPRRLWVDAISINQHDIAERNTQIQYMYDIYERANRVIVWLGPHEDDSELAIQAIKHLRLRSNRQFISRHDHDLECIQNLERVVLSIASLIERPWFRRSWIRQEISAAQRVIVKCGDDETTWSALKKAVNCRWKLHEKAMNNNATEWGYKSILPQQTTWKNDNLTFLKRNVMVGQSLLSGTPDLRSLWYYHSGGLLEYLMVSRAFDATDPRDKVYSVLGMTHTPIEKESPKRADDISMETLSLDDKEAEASQSNKAPKEGAEEVEEADSAEPPQVVSQIPKIRVDYSATVSEVYQHIAKHIINTQLTLDILILISTHRSPTGASRDLPSWTPDWRVPISQIGLEENHEYFHFKMGAAGFTKCLPQDQADLGRLVVQGFRLDVLTQLLEYGVESIPHPPEEPTGSLAPFNEEIHLRRVCSTGEFVGFAPREAIVGDEVWILYGCRMPMVLRLAEEKSGELRYQVVGPCYLPTLMWGKGLKQFLEAGGKLETIVLV